jgi:3-phenylpropionate/trans-cinnamate dioxygenase ferredoxin reductase subunit
LHGRAEHARVPSNVLIVGGGLAAQRAVETLRARDHRGPIRVVCGEPEPPYDRPPLSKELGAAPFRPPDWYAENDVELLLGRRAARLEVAARRVLLEDGGALG